MAGACFWLVAGVWMRSLRVFFVFWMIAISCTCFYVQNGLRKLENASDLCQKLNGISRFHNNANYDFTLYEFIFKIIVSSEFKGMWHFACSINWIAWILIFKSLRQTQTAHGN